MNQVILVGRLLDVPKINDDNQVIITLGISRSYKNSEGDYEKDYIPCILFKNSLTALSYLRKDDVVGIKGQIQQIDDKIVVAADKITFLSTKKRDEDSD